MPETYALRIGYCSIVLHMNAFWYERNITVANFCYSNDFLSHLEEKIELSYGQYVDHHIHEIPVGPEQVSLF